MRPNLAFEADAGKLTDRDWAVNRANGYRLKARGTS